MLGDVEVEDRAAVVAEHDPRRGCRQTPIDEQHKVAELCPRVPEDARTVLHVHGAGPGAVESTRAGHPPVVERVERQCHESLAGQVRLPLPGDEPADRVDVLAVGVMHIGARPPRRHLTQGLSWVPQNPDALAFREPECRPAKAAELPSFSPISGGSRGCSPTGIPRTPGASWTRCSST
jgi:hypothetical protein